jgi:chitin-binding protein
VNLGNASGRQKLLAVWNIGDTANAFYSCVDLQIGGRAATAPAPEPAPPPAAPDTGTWVSGTSYPAGSEVTFDGVTYEATQSHTALPGWEPASTPALWQSR